MEFRTIISIPLAKEKIQFHHSLLSIGSCFSTCIGNKLSVNKFDISVNPFGTLFNPVSIFRLLDYALEDNSPPPHTYIERDGIWYNLDFHSDFSDQNKQALKKRIEEKLKEIASQLAKISYLIITPGTAWVYETESEKHLVANCHKLPQTRFRKKRLLEVDEIIIHFEALYKKLKRINPGIQFIFTISPVRHLKDTLELNALSKATLKVAVNKINEKFTDVDYFPSYEIMMDDLRDYRFYESDMIHPNTTAEDYIWEQFKEKYFSEEVRSFIKKWQKVKQALEHRPFHPNSAAHKAFLEKTIEQVASFKGIINVEKELETLKKRLHEINRLHE